MRRRGGGRRPIAAVPPETLRSVDFSIQHVFLPPKLPQSDHEEHGADHLLKTVAQAATEFSCSFPLSSDEHQVWTKLSYSLRKWIDIYDRGTPCNGKIVKALQTMDEDGKTAKLR